MPPEPLRKRAVVFFDGQNVFHTAKELWGHSFPNYDPLALSRLVCARESWRLHEVRFYTGVPSNKYDARWHGFWSRKIAHMGQQGVFCFTRQLRYHQEEVVLGDGSRHAIHIGREKGIDIRIALDVIRLAQARVFDVAVIFSQDSDLSEVAAEIRRLARDQNRWVKMASAFPYDAKRPRRGIDRTDWLPISRAEYDSCLDPTDYRETRDCC